MVKKKIIDRLNIYKSFGIEYSESINYTKYFRSDENLPNKVDQLDSYIQHCSLCELSKYTNIKNIGYGNCNSDFYIVGVSTDFNNRNILKILDYILENILKLNKEQIYMTNLLKCPVETQNIIDKKNIDLCKEYFIKQLDIIKPKYIIALGDVINYLVKNENQVSYKYGNCYDYNGIKIIPMISLEFVYKNPSYQDELYKDFKKLKILMEKK